jgi:starch-binding outer membrane protein, SusD/RagB family
MKKYFVLLIMLIAVIVSCDIEQQPESTASKTAVFGSENGLKLYTNSFYSILPNRGTHRADHMSDYLARRDVPSFIIPNGFSPLIGTGWSWGDLRNINYFIVNNNNPAVPDATRRHYQGLARFFRAYFYFNKVKMFGDVPWINKPLDVSDPDLYKGRDPRTLVMDSVLADINYACENINITSDGTRSTVTKYIAYALKARIALHEGTFRKYHTNLNLTGTANAWLTQAAEAAKVVIDQSGHSLYEGAGLDRSYRALFVSQAPVASEIMMAAISDLALSILNDGNWYWTSGTYGDKASFIRPFINTYLNIDGTPFTNDPNYTTMTFMNEVKNRDKRLQQTIRSGDYKRISGGVLVPAPPLFSYTFTGYQPIKWALDDMYYDTRDLNNNAISMFRYAEVLLTYAEAKAELGTLTDAEWALTIGALRKRAGITGGLTTKPTAVDTYLQSVYFPNISDPVILEVRRERGIELALEGFRFDDIVRWRRGELMEMEWTGFYVPELVTPLDLNEDGIMDVAFFQGTRPTPGVSGVTYINVSPTVSGGNNPHKLKNGTFGEITWLNTIPRKWEEKNYLYPIPEPARLANPALGQNPGW